MGEGAPKVVLDSASSRPVGDNDWHTWLIRGSRARAEYRYYNMDVTLADALAGRLPEEAT